MPEPRLDKLAEIYHPPKITRATVEYVDVGGLQAGRAGAGAERNTARDAAVLAPLREVNALAHVLRVFSEGGEINPLSDAETLDLEP